MPCAPYPHSFAAPSVCILAARQGELLGQDPMEEILAIFAALSQSDGNAANDGLITLPKLQQACSDFEVAPN